MLATHPPLCPMIDSHDAAGPHAEPTEASNRPLHRLRRKVMAKLFDDEALPETLGRYELVRALGAGGMGTVYAAKDPELDREVAVKRLHFGRDDADGKRLLREAKSLARLSHPNVVQVHDVGTEGEQLFLAMELVPGSDLRQWLATGAHSWPEIVGKFVAAGMGLAAAHDVGLVHRDFKPENVLVRDDGVAKVADFGLVHVTGQTHRANRHQPTSDELDDAVRSLTHAGTFLGTPSYMSPEQQLALPTDARSDQFSFCVSLYEGLYGRRPFEADTLRELIETTRRNEVTFPSRPAIPEHVRRAIRRGLEVDPAQRHPDMNALLEQLQRPASPAWRRWLAVALLVALALVTASSYVAWRILGLPDDSELGVVGVAMLPCARATNTDDVYDATHRERIARKLTKVAPDVGADAARVADAALVEHLRAWRDVYTSTCEATAGDNARRVARRLCLRDRLQQVRDVVSALERPDARLASHAADVVQALDPIADCDDRR